MNSYEKIANGLSQEESIQNDVQNIRSKVE
jgi:hypothetical protein